MNRIIKIAQRQIKENLYHRILKDLKPYQGVIIKMIASKITESVIDEINKSNETKNQATNGRP